MKITITLIAVVLSFTLNAQIIQDQKIIYSNTQTFQDSVKMSGLSGSGTSLIIDENGVISKGSGGSGATSINGLSDGTTLGTNNVGLGSGALSLNTGSYNAASGVDALKSNTTGGGNTANGGSALYSNTTGGANTASGAFALYTNTTGGDNTASGADALRANTTGDYNIAIGRGSLSNNTTGENNTASGYQSLLANTTGDYNIGIGRRAGNAITTGSNNTIIGDYAGTTSLSSTVVIAAGATERLKVDASGLYINGVSFNLNSAEIFLGNSSNQSVATAVTGEVTISNTGVTEVTGIDGNISIQGFKPIITQTGQTRTLSEGDEGSLIIATNVDFTTVTIPLNIFTLGTEIELLRKTVGTLSISAASGVTLNGASQGSESVTAQWGSVTIKLIGTNEWWAVGGI
tara:strand:+ start:1010 stop:2221 length:1212 start_codon:yes stop_codon:yes gene_type:complete